MFKVFFKDGNVRRAIKIFAKTPEEAVAKARAKRKGHRFFAIPVYDDDHYVRLGMR